MLYYTMIKEKNKIKRKIYKKDFGGDRPSQRTDKPESTPFLPCKKIVASS